MNIETLIEIIRESLYAIEEPRFYETERGFQGQLLIELSKRIPKYFPDGMAVIEQEHQKTLELHGLRIRPDIVIHQPFDQVIHETRRHGNFAVIELKLRAGPKKAAEDFKNLYSMLTLLDYPVGIFINIGHSCPQAIHVPDGARGRIIAFATKLMPDGVQVVVGRA
jgi:hypothetical protein